MGGTELGCGFAGNFVAAFIAQAIAWKNRFEFVLLINGLQKWTSRQFLEIFIFAFLVRCPVNRGFEAFLFVSSPILLGERGARHIRVWGQTHSYQPPDAFVSGSRRARIWGGVRWKI